MSKICVIISALSNHLLKRQRLQKRGLALLLASVLLIIAGNAHAITATGEFKVDDLHGMYHDIHIQLATESIISMKYEATCYYPDHQKIELIREQDGYQIDNYTYSRDPDLTWKPLPLAPGNYVIRLRCEYDSLPLYRDTPEYSLNYTSVAGASKFNRDSEPDDTEDDVVDLTKGRLIEGLLGYVGYPDLTKYPDSSDSYYLNIPKDTKIKFKLEYDEALIHFPCFNDPASELELFLYYDINGAQYAFHDTWYFSGDVSEEITITAESPLAHLIVRGGCKEGSYYAPLLPKTNYGGYRITVIVNGDEGPNAELGAIRDISTEYWDEADRKFYTVDDLVPGWESEIDISITNHGSLPIAVKLTHGLSIDGGPIEWVGNNNLSLSGGVTKVYGTTLITPDDTPYPKKGTLVTVLYGSDNSVLDTSQTNIKVWSPKIQASMLFILMYLNKINENINDPDY